MKKAFAILVLLLAAVAALTESAYWLGYLNRAADSDVGTGDCIVLVLGYPTESDGTPHPVQRFRVEAGVAAYRAHQCGQIAFSGGAVRNRYVEAESMAAIALALGVSENDVIVEGRSRTTWENIGCSAPLLKGGNRVLLVSDSLHAHRAKRYACRQIPSLCQKVFAVGGMPPLALFWWSVPAAAHELLARLRDFFNHELTGLNNASTCMK
ncbi:MAG: YdcF family protein [Gammaproteobacteria bacterium]